MAVLAGFMLMAANYLSDILCIAYLTTGGKVTCALTLVFGSLLWISFINLNFNKLTEDRPATSLRLGNDFDVALGK